MMDLVGALPAKGYRKLLSRVRELTDALGRVRDLDILIRSLGRKQASLPPPLRDGVAPLLQQCRKERRLRQEQLREFFRDLGRFGFEKRFSRWLSA